MQLKSKILLVSLGLAGALLTGCSSVDLNPNGPDQYAGDPFSNPQSSLSQQSIYFAFDSYTVPAEAQAMIEAHAQYLATHPSATVVLEGNTDERGGREYNLALGQNAATVLKTVCSFWECPPSVWRASASVRNVLVPRVTMRSLINKTAV